jgi:hypothetical protein
LSPDTWGVRKAVREATDAEGLYASKYAKDFG